MKSDRGSIVSHSQMGDLAVTCNFTDPHDNPPVSAVSGRGPAGAPGQARCLRAERPWLDC
ncbi:hypothetical protein Mro03_72270 [Microbispora rosea subsp. rosea]|nr:hypothetical protein Mro03_72270 [Microbispora rosea subsp. rosea]